MKLKVGFTSSIVEKLLSSSRKPVVWVILALLIFGAFFSTFSLVPPVKKAKAAGTTYYIDATGGLDGNTGLSEGQAWKTIAKVNGATFVASDTILFKRGETWAEQLVPKRDTLNFGAYGSGALPRIAGAGSWGYAGTKANITLTDLWIAGVNHATAGPITVTRCIIRNTTGAAIAITSGITATFSHCVIVGSNTYAVSSSVGANIIGLTDCIIIASKSQAFYQNTGTITYTNSLVAGNGASVASNIGTATDGGGNIMGSLPGTTAPVVTATPTFVLTLDDEPNSYWEDVMTIAESYGVEITGFIYLVNRATPSVVTAITAVHTRGHEIGLHSMSHSNLTAATLFTVTTTNANPTVTINAAGKTITLTTTTPGNTVVVDWSVTAKTIANLRTACVGKAWTITNGTNVLDGVDLKSLADSGGAQVPPYAAAPNTTAYWTAEIVDAQAWFTANIGVTPTVIAPPYGNSNAGLVTFIKDTAGLASSRLAAVAGIYLSSVNIYGVTVMNNTLSAATEAAVRAEARHRLLQARELGQVQVILTHNAAAFTAEQLGWFIDEVQDGGGVWKTYSHAIADIVADHSTADGVTYTKTYADGSDYHLLGSSPAIGAASDGTDIGVYQYVPVVSAPNLSAVSTSSINIVFNANSNPGIIQYAIYNETATQYVQADGTLAAGAVWQTRTAWGGAGGIANTGLTANTSYTYKVKARGTDNVTETALSGGTSKYTLGSSSPINTSSPKTELSQSLKTADIEYKAAVNKANKEFLATIKAAKTAKERREALAARNLAIHEAYLKMVAARQSIMKAYLANLASIRSRQHALIDIYNQALKSAAIEYRNKTQSALSEYRSNLRSAKTTTERRNLLKTYNQKLVQARFDLQAQRAAAYRSYLSGLKALVL